MKLKSITYLSLIGSLFAVATVDAQISISEGETAVFTENFDNNYAGWTNVAIVNGEGVAATKQAKIDGGVWAPTIANDGGEVRSAVDLNELDLSEGALSLYMNVNVEDILKNPANARYGMELRGPNGGRNAKFTFQIEPGNGVAKQFSYLQYRQSSGNSVTDNLGNTYSTGVITDPAAYYTFKLTITPVSGGMATLQAYYYDEATAAYVPFPGDTNGAGSVPAAIGTGLDKGLFTSLLINSRNGTAASSGSNAANFAQVIVTQAK